jgi:hypothetical protein
MKPVKLTVFLAVAVAVVLAACIPVAQPEPDRPALGPTPIQPVVATPFVPLQTPTLPEPAIPATGEMYNYDQLLRDLTAAGLEPEPAGTVLQPFFDVTASVLNVIGSDTVGDIQVFQFPDAQARQAAEDTISATADVIGAFQPQWVDIPNFWSQGRIIVLYIGQDFTILQRLDEVMGERVRIGETDRAVLPVTGAQAQRLLADWLGIDITGVQIGEIRYMEWPDACLGLPAQDELCAQVITPGYQILLQVDERQFEVRTDTVGSIIRIAEQVQ